MLLVGALLFVRSLRNVITLDAGFQRDGVLITAFDASRLGYSPERRAILYRELLSKIRSTPGVDDAATVRVIPVTGDYWNDTIEIPGARSSKNLVPRFNRVSAGYFRTMGTPLVAGRDFDNHDTASSPAVAIVNEEFSNKFLGKTNPIEKQFRLLVGPGEPQQLYQIIGLVKNSKYQNLRDEFKPVVFVAQTQDKAPGLGVNVILRPPCRSVRCSPLYSGPFCNRTPAYPSSFRFSKSRSKILSCAKGSWLLSPAFSEF